MNLQGEVTRILFKEIHPEEIHGDIVKNEIGVSSKCVSRFILEESQLNEQHKFFRGANNLHGVYSQEELDLLRKLIVQQLGEDNNISVFHLLPLFSKDILTFKEDVPLCGKRHVLAWRELSYEIGQDLLVTAHRAFFDVIESGKTDFFAWPSIIHANNPLVQEVMSRGVTENHSHLYGSFPSFDLSWVCLMNHPENIYKMHVKQKGVPGNFVHDLNPTSQLEEGYNRLSWEDRLQLSCLLRALLFMHIQDSYKYEDMTITGKRYSNDTSMWNDMLLNHSVLKEYEIKKTERTSWLCTIVNSLRFIYGEKWYQSDGTGKILDYAFPSQLDEDRNKGQYRLLAGERYFLYECLRNIFSGRWTSYEQDLFYLYTLLKSRIGNELIQLNHRVGFHNFMEYQDRKGLLWWGYDEYYKEGYRLAVNAKMEDQNIVKEEDRIIPKETVRDLIADVISIDKEIIFANDVPSKEKYFLEDKYRGKWNWRHVRKRAKDLNNYYVAHFVKNHFDTKIPDVEFGICKPRNHKERMKAKRQALALANALAKYPLLGMRIRGIDACNREIGCRPETFATEFRFLKTFKASSLDMQSITIDRTPWTNLGVTYHVGEDFLDIADGLRAIDEAVSFLELKRGDRIGHALAMGVAPEEHYRIKKMRSLTTKQDRLDDLVWLLCRSREFNVSIPLDLIRNMEEEANRLIYEIYDSAIKDILEGGYGQLSIRDYYRAWKMRGDHPDWHDNPDSMKSKGYNNTLFYGGSSFSLMGQYVSKTRGSAVSIYEDSPLKKAMMDILLYHYHFDSKVREKGIKACEVDIEPSYIKLMRSMQDAMIHDLTDKGIYVECNPSSNYLIGTIEKYEHHPIFRFNQYGMDSDTKNHLCVSINTDDMGIFDTSLESEYALIAAALENMKDENGIRIYDDDFIHDYLEHIRVMGMRQAFVRSGKTHG